MLNQIEHKLRAPVSKKMACGHFPAIALHFKRRKIGKVSSEAPLETGEMEIYTMHENYKNAIYNRSSPEAIIIHFWVNNIVSGLLRLSGFLSPWTIFTFRF